MATVGSTAWRQEQAAKAAAAKKKTGVTSTTSTGKTATPTVKETAATGGSGGKVTSTVKSASGGMGKNNAYVSGVDDYGDTDYSVLLNKAMSAGASADEVQKLLDSRTQKAVDKGYTQYAYDDVYTAAKEYIKKNAAATPAVSGKVEDYSSYIEEMNRAAREAALAELEAAYKKNLAAIDRSGEGVEEQYRAARNAAAGASEVARRNFAEYAAGSGLNSGTGGQAELARSVALQNDLNSITTAQRSALADLELQRSQAEMEYNNAIAQAEAEGNYELAAALYQEKVRVNNALLAQTESEWQKALQEYQLRYQAGRDAVEDQRYADETEWDRLAYVDKTAYDRDQDTAAQALQKAQTLAAFGDFSGYLELGYTPEQVALMRNYYAAQQGLLNGQGWQNTRAVEAVGGGAVEDDPDTGPVDDSGQVKNDFSLAILQAELARLEDRLDPSAVVTQAAGLIRAYNDRGTITDETARRLLARYGIQV